MNTATARNTNRDVNKKWEVIDYRTGKRIVFADPETNARQGEFSKAEAEYLAKSVNNALSA